MPKTIQSIIILAFISTGLVAQDATLEYPVGIAATSAKIYVADRQLPGIWEIVDGKPQVYHQAAKKFGTPLNAIRCLAIDTNGSLLAGDSATREVYRFNAEGKAEALTGGDIGIPMGITVAADGTIYVADLELHRVVTIDAEGEVAEFAKVQGPSGLSFDKSGILYVATRSADRLVKIDAGGEVTAVEGANEIRFAQDVAVDGNGRVLVTDGYGKSIWNFAGGANKVLEGEPLVHPVGITVSPLGIYLVDPRGLGVLKLDADMASKVLSE